MTTFNPSDKAAAVTLSNADLTASVAGTVSVRATNGKSTGKWYCEITVDSGTEPIIGVANSTANINSYPGADSNGWAYYRTGQKLNSGGAAAYGNTYTAGDVIGIAWDADNGKLFFSKNGTWQASGDPAAGTNAAYTGLSGTLMVIVGRVTSTVVFTGNWGASAFSASPPTGFDPWDGAAGHPAVKRMGGVPFASPNRGVW